MKKKKKIHLIFRIKKKNKIAVILINKTNRPNLTF